MTEAVALTARFRTFERADKRTFDRAFADGKRVSMVKDPEWARGNETFIGAGFTRDTVADPYCDGPSRAGERWFFWVEVDGSATPAGPVEFVWLNGWKMRAPEASDISEWRFFCECGATERGAVRDDLQARRDEHAATHADR